MQNMHWKILILLVAVGLAVFSLFNEGIRLGKDLQGGLSLVYQLNIPEDADNRDAIIAQTIEVLKDRVNPQGVLDITIIAQGQDRIEIIMPLPSEEVKALQAEIDSIIQDILSQARIDESELELALRGGEAVEQFAPKIESEQRQRLVDLQEAFNRKEDLLVRYQEARADPQTDPEVLRDLEQQTAEALNRFEDLYGEVLQQSLRESDLRRMLRLATEPRQVKDPDTGRIVTDEDGNAVLEPSLRSIELAALKERYPQLAEQFDGLINAWDEYNRRRKGFDDPEDLKRLLRGAGVLEFRIAVERGETTGFNADQLRQDLQENGPEVQTNPNVLWMPINDLKQWYETESQLRILQSDPAAYFGTRGLEAAEYRGRYYLLIYDTDTITRKLTHEAGMPQWSLESAQQTTDDLGRPAVAFNLDDAGGIAMRQLTGANIGKPMSIVLDGEVYSAPNIQSAIGKNGQITGSFSAADIQYLIRVLASGSLEARLSEEPIAENIIGPSIGRDNLERGLWACIWGLCAVAVFMVLYYFFAGVVADFALLCNAVLIFGIMAMQQASFTLPGIAGVVLTIGMAVDANVLIYERIREEIFAGEEDIRAAIRQGYAKALSTIIDGNVTNLIVCVVLYYTATAEVKGFALTLSIGILATLFTALFVTRIIYTLYTDLLKFQSLPMLPSVVPAIHRALEPNINWIGLRKVFIPMSAILVTGGVLLVAMRGADILDTEFRGGVSMTMQTKVAPPGWEGSVAEDGGRIMLSRPEVEQRVHNMGENPDLPPDSILRNFRTASVLAAGGNQEGSLADAFQIKVVADAEDAAETNRLVNAIVEEFQDVLSVTPPHSFQFDNEAAPPPGSTHEVTLPTLGEVIGRPGFTQNLRSFEGGVAVVIDEIDPPVQLAEIRERITRMRKQQEFIHTAERRTEIFGLTPSEGGEGYISIAVVAYDPDYEFRADALLWQGQMAETEWKIITDALKEPAQLEQVSSFSASVAESLAASAVVAVILSLLGILTYVWIRFGSLRYSAAAVLALVHDVCFALGALALTHLIAGNALAAMLGIEEFRINLEVIAALLTIIGYSLNDTIVILDRIRENRGKVPLASAETINLSINQTISRTLLTSGTTLLAIAVMYAEGGTGIRPFAYSLLIGIVVGTYSTVAIAAPLVYRRSIKDSGPSDTELAEVKKEQPPAEVTTAVP